MPVVRPENVIVEPEKVTLLENVSAPENVREPLSSPSVPPDVPVFTVAAVPKDTPLVFVQVITPSPVAVQSPLTKPN